MVLALVILGLGVWLWPAVGSPHTLWIDEIHSLQLSQLPVARILDEAAQDFHPPGYVLALKAWIQLPRSLGLEPGLRWARSLNLVAWALAAAGTGILAHRYSGGSRGVLLVLVAFGGPAAATVVADLRGYGFAYCALSLAILILPLAMEEPPRRRAAVIRWLAYAGLLSLALWAHLLASIVVVCMTLAWFLHRLAATPSPPERSFLLGSTAHVLPWVLYLPWLLRIPDQVGRLQAVDTDWMTPPTLENLARVFYWWIPFGRTSMASPQGRLVLALLGGMALLLPVGLFYCRRKVARGAAPARRLVNLTLLVGCASILTFWLLARLDVAATFHGPRYPLLVAGMLLIGAASAASSGGRSVLASSAILAPLVLAAALGHTLLAAERSATAGFPLLEREILSDRDRPPRGVYLSPSELIPFVASSLPGLRLLPAESFPCGSSLPVLVLDVNPWKSIARPRDLLLAHLLDNPTPRIAATRLPFRDDRIIAILYAVENLDEEVAAALCERQLEPVPSAPAAAASAAAWEQRPGDGFSYLEFTGESNARRWSTAPRVAVRFDRHLPAGSYVLHFRAARAPYPAATVPMRFQLPSSNLDLQVPVSAGQVVLDLPFLLEKGTRPRLLVGHPLWSPAEELASGDPRQLGFQFQAAWITRRGPGTSG